MYMGWLRKHQAKEHQPVVGIICVFSASGKLKMAAQMINGLEVFEYSLSFSKVDCS